VGDAIASALGQVAEADVEVLLADDGSADFTEAIAKEFGARVTYLRQAHSGAAAARNLGLRAARGDFLSFLDSDDIWLPGKIQAELEAFSRFPEAHAIMSDAASWREDRLVDSSWFAVKEFPVIADEPFLAPDQPSLWVYGSRFATCSMTLRRECLTLMGTGDLFDDSLRKFEDWDMEIRLLRYCRVAIIPRVFSNVRRYPDSTRSRMPGDEPDPVQFEANLRCEIYILRRALSLGWPESVVRDAEAKCERLRGLLAPA